MHSVCLKPTCQEVRGKKHVLDASRVTAGKACKKRSAAMWTGSSFHHQLLCRVLVPELPYCVDCLVGHAGCGVFLKLCKIFEAAVLKNISDETLSEL